VAVYFVETSALAKRYIAETGSMWLRALLDPSTGCSIYVVRVTAVEIIAAITTFILDSKVQCSLGLMAHQVVVYPHGGTFLAISHAS
jgi:hypothetical protein